MRLRQALLAVATVTGMSLTAGAAPAFATNTLYVHQLTDTSCGSGSPYVMIQAAVDAAQPGDKIEVCPGTYTEQVTIPAGKDNLTLESVKPLQAIIKAPPAMTAPQAIVRVNGAKGVRILRFTITGPGSSGCNSIGYGVLVDAGGSAWIAENHVTNITDAPFGGCQNGVAIEVGDNTGATSATATIIGNLVDNYQKNGVTVERAGSKALVGDNVIRGVGPSSVIAQNGVQISDGASAWVIGNAVSGNVYTGANYGSIGILLYGAVATVVTSNSVKANDTGIYAYQADKRSSVSRNHVSASNYDGITVDTSTGTQVSENDSSGNTNPSNGEGFGIYNTTAARLSDNTARNNATNGFYADAFTSGNSFHENSASHNGQHDCRDDSHGTGTAGTANSWIEDQGATSLPPGICKPARRDHEDAQVQSELRRKHQTARVNRRRRTVKRAH